MIVKWPFYESVLYRNRVYLYAQKYSRLLYFCICGWGFFGCLIADDSWFFCCCFCQSDSHIINIQIPYFFYCLVLTSTQGLKSSISTHSSLVWYLLQGFSNVLFWLHCVVKPTFEKPLMSHSTRLWINRSTGIMFDFYSLKFFNLKYTTQYDTDFLLRSMYYFCVLWLSWLYYHEQFSVLV